MLKVAEKAKTNREFLESLLDTEASKSVSAKRWIGDFLKFGWSSSAATEESIEDVIEIFSERIFSDLKSLRSRKALHKEMLENIHRFFEEIIRIAQDFNIKVSLKAANDILCQP